MHFSTEHGDHEGLSLCLMFLFVYCRITLIILDFNWWLSTSHLNEARGKCSIIEITCPKQSTNIFQLGKISWSKPTCKKQQNQLYHKHPNKKLNIAMGKIHPYLLKKKHGGCFPAIAMLVFSERSFFFSLRKNRRKSSPSARAFGSCKTMPPRRPFPTKMAWWWQNAQWIYSSPPKKVPRGEKRRWLFSGNMTQLWDSICNYIYSNCISQNHMKIVQVEYALILLTLDVQVEKKRWTVKHIGCQLFYQLPVPWFQQTVPCQDRCQEMTAQAFLKVDNESQKQFENRCNFCCFQGQYGDESSGSAGDLRDGFVALFFFQKKSQMQTLMVLKIFFGS